MHNGNYSSGGSQRDLEFCSTLQLEGYVEIVGRVVA